MAAPPRVAVVGGGIAGSLCALALRRHGAEPTIFDMGRRFLGGRLGTAPGRQGAPAGDRGAQFMCTSEEGSHFAQVLRFLEQNGLVHPWTGRFGALGSRGGGFLPKEIIDRTTLGSLRKDREGPAGEPGGTDGDFCGFMGGGSKSRLYVGVPSMGSVCEGICSLGQVPVRRGVHVTDLRLAAGAWSVFSDTPEQGACEQGFHAVVIASHNPALAAGVVRGLAADLQREVDEGVAAPDAEVPQERIVERLRGLAGSLQVLRDLHKLPVYALSAAFPLGSLSARLPFDAVACPTSPRIQLIVREGSKPGRGSSPSHGEELWTAISTANFAQELLRAEGPEEAAAERLAGHLVELLGPALEGGEGTSVPPPVRVSAKCWRAGFTGQTLGLKEDCVSLEPWRLAICGDFVRNHPSPMEAAALSGVEAGERVASWFSGNAE